MDRFNCCDPPKADFVVQQLKSIPNIGWLTSTPETGMVSVSATIAKLVGLSSQSQQLPIAEFIDAIHPADRSQVAAVLTDPMVRGTSEQVSEQEETEPELTEQAQTLREQIGEKSSAAEKNNTTNESGRRQFEIEFHLCSPTDGTEVLSEETDTGHNQARTEAKTEQSSQANIELATQDESPIETTGLEGVRVRMRGEVIFHFNRHQNATEHTDSQQNSDITDTTPHRVDKTNNNQQKSGEEVSIQAVIEVVDRSQLSGGVSTDDDKPRSEDNTVDDSAPVNTTNLESNNIGKRTPSATASNTDKTAVETVRANEHTIRSHHMDELFTNGPVSIVQWDSNSEWSVRYASKNVESVLGHSKKELEQEDPPYKQLVHPEDQPQVTHRVNKETESDTKYFQHEPYRILTDTGEVRWILDTTHIIREDDGSVESYLGYLINITPQKLNEIQLKQAERIASTGSWQLDTQNGEVNWSEGLCEIFKLGSDNAPKTLNQSLGYFHPEDREQLQEIYQQPIDAELDGEYRIQVNGREKWIEISSKNICNNEGTVVSVVGVVKEVTEHVEQRQNAETINTTLQKLNSISLPESGDVINTVAGCIDEIFNPNSISAYAYVDDGHFEPVEYVNNATEIVGEIDPERGVFWDAFVNNKIQLIDEESVSATQLPDEKRDNTILAIPVGNWGFILAFVLNKNKIKETTIESIKPIILTAIETFKRLDQTKALQQRRVDLKENISKLEREKSLNNLIRTLIKQIVGIDRTDEVLEQSCDVLSTYDGFDGVWVGKRDIKSDEITSIVGSPSVRDYLNELNLSSDGNTSEPTTQVIATHSTVGPINTTEYLSNEPWATVALKHGYQSIVSVPIVYNELTHGALTILTENTSTLSKNMVSLIKEIGVLLGYVLNSVERQLALNTDGHRNVEYQLKIEPSDPIAKLADHLSHEVTIYNITQNNKNSTLLHCEIPNVDIEDLTSATEDIDEILNISHIENFIYEINIISPSVATKIMRINIFCQELCISGEKAILVATSNNDINQAQTTTHLNNLFKNATIRAKTEVPISDGISWPIILPNALSEQQEMVLRTAYYSGYFDQRRKRTGGEIAESIGIAQPTFSNRLRAAQRNLFAAIWD